MPFSTRTSPREHLSEVVEVSSNFLAERGLRAAVKKGQLWLQTLIPKALRPELSLVNWDCNSNRSFTVFLQSVRTSKFELLSVQRERDFPSFFNKDS